MGNPYNEEEGEKIVNTNKYEFTIVRDNKKTSTCIWRVYGSRIYRHNDRTKRQ